MSVLTAVSKVWIVGSILVGLNVLLFSLSLSIIVGLYSVIPKWAFNLILLRKLLRSSCSLSLWYWGGLGKKLSPLLSS